MFSNQSVRTSRNAVGFTAAIFLFVGLFSASTLKAEETQKENAEAAPAEQASAETLEDQLKTLEVPADQAPVGVSSEQLYSVQTRNSPLGGRIEATVGGGTNLSGTNLLTSRHVQGGLRWHMTDRWSLGATYSQVFNELSPSAKQLLDQNQQIPDTPYASSRRDLTIGMNTFYGKIRMSMDSVVYFDQYINLGAAQIELNTETVTGGVVEAGFAVWLGKWGNVRLGVRDYIYNEKTRAETRLVNDWHGVFNFGVLFL